MERSQIVTLELESQLRSALVEIKSLRKENLQLQQQFPLFERLQHNASLKEKYSLSTRAAETINNLEVQLKLSTQENKRYQAELAYYQSIEQPAIPNSQQLSAELEDIQKYFRAYFNLQDELVNTLPNQILRECWQAINQTFKAQFNSFQEASSLQEQLGAYETEYKSLLYVKQIERLKEMAKNSKQHDLRVQIEATRKDIQQKQADVRRAEKEITELQKEFSYICKIEQRRLSSNLEQEKQLIALKTDPIECRIRQHSDHFRVSNNSRSAIAFKQTKAAEEQLRLQSEEDRSQVEKTIELTRKKLSRQLSQFQNLK